MQFAAALFTKVFAGAGAAAGAATTAGTVATAGSGILGTLGKVAGVFSAVSSIGAGAAANSQAKVEARQQEFESRNEFIDGRETSAALKAELYQTIANQQVAFAAGGAGLGSVSVEAARRQATADAENELSINSSTSLTRSMQRRRQAANTRARGRSALTQGFLGAASTGVNTYIDAARIG